MKRSLRSILVWPLSLLFILFTWNPMIAKGEIKEFKAGDESYEKNREPGLIKILSVLEKRLGDQKLLQKAKDKLLTLKESELALIASLSEQMAKEGERPGVDIAFLLITALIILS